MLTATVYSRKKNPETLYSFNKCNYLGLDFYFYYSTVKLIRIGLEIILNK
jgi:hypothetical protein